MSVALSRAEFRALRAALRPRPAAARTMLVLALDLSLLFAAQQLLVPAALWRWLLALALLTLALLHFYLIHHECVHRSVFANDRFNVWLGQLLGFALLYPFHARRRSHMLHHVWAGHLERDPTNARARARLGTLAPAALRLLELLWRTGLPFLALNERIGLWRSAFVGDPRERAWAYFSCAGYALMCATAFCLPAVGLALLVYALALALSLVVEELINLPHHAEAKTVCAQLSLWEQGEVTHSCASVPIWSSLVLLHFNLHTAHHLFPGLPWHRLPSAERALCKRKKAQRTSHELTASWRLRQRRFVDVFAAYFPRV